MRTDYISLPHSRTVEVGNSPKGYVQLGYTEYNLSDLYALAFGYVASPHLNVDPENYIPLARLSKEGKAIMMPMQLGGYLMPFEPIVRVKERWKVIETDIDGLEGTFKENWRKDDLEVSIEGFIIDEDNIHDYPLNLVREFREVFNTGASVSVDEHTILAEVFGIHHLAIYSVEYPEMNGFPNVQPYKITAKSDQLHEDNFGFEITG